MPTEPILTADDDRVAGQNASLTATARTSKLRITPLLLGLLYLSGLVYFGLQPFSYTQIYWNNLLATLPQLPDWLFNMSPRHAGLNVLLGVPLGLLFAAAMPEAPDRWRRAARTMLLWVILSLLTAGTVLSQFWFINSATLRYHAIALPLGTAIGIGIWLLTGSGIRSALTEFDPLRPATVMHNPGWTRQLSLAATAWLLWLALGSPGLSADADVQRDWLIAPWAWAWPMAFIGLTWSLSSRHPPSNAKLLPWLTTQWAALSAAGLLLAAIHEWATIVPIAWQQTLLAQQAGIIGGLVLGWRGALLPPRAWRLFSASGNASAAINALVPGLAIATTLLLVIMLPASGELSLAGLFGPGSPYSLSSSLAGSAENIYQAIKIAMLWLPVAMLFAFVGHGGTLLGWTGALTAGLLLLCLPWLADWPARTGFELASIVLGILSGVWIGRHSLFGDAAHARNTRQSTAVAGTPTVQPVATTRHSSPGIAHTVNAERAGSPPRATAWRNRDTTSASRTETRRTPSFRTRDATAVVSAAASIDVNGVPQPADDGPNRFRSRPDTAIPAQADTPPDQARQASPIRQRTTGIAGWLERGLAIAILTVVLLVLLDFPRWPIPLGLGLVACVALLWRYPWASLLLIPALLPVLDLAPWSGRIYLDEFDLLLLVTLAMLLWHGWAGHALQRLPRAVVASLLLMLASWTVALLIGLWPLTPMDGNAFSNYWSHYNALRVYKGLLGGLLLLLLLSRGLAEDRRVIERWLLPGLWLGLALLAFSGIREHWLFAGPFAFAAEYRITSGFSSMHTGGGHIEAYLVMVIPFLWLWPARSHDKRWLALGALVLIAATYVSLATVSRGGIAGLLTAIAVLALGSLRSRHGPVQRRLAGISVAFVTMLVLLGAALGVFGGGHLSERVTRIASDFDSRWSHWSNALAMRTSDIQTDLLGMGLGRFPSSYLGSDRAATIPTLHHFEQQQGQSYLRLNAGETFYLAQRVSIDTDTRYRLRLTVRGFAPNSQVDVPLCEKQLLDSHDCRWNSFKLAHMATRSTPGNNSFAPPVPSPTPPLSQTEDRNEENSFTTRPGGQWQRFERYIDSGRLGDGPWWWSRPVELALFNPIKGSVIDILDVRLQAPDGEDLLSNGDFSAASDYWLFKSHDFLPWHIENLWVEILFEQGWLGVISFAALLLVILMPLWRRVWGGEPLATVLLASISGALVVGLVGSLFDAPRLTLLLLLLLWLAALTARPEQNDAGDNRPTSR